MKIEKVLASPGLTGFYSDDKAAIAKEAVLDGHFYLGNPLTRGYSSVRMPGESVSVLLMMDNGEMAYGDCCSSQYSGAGGRGEPFSADRSIPLLQNVIAPALEGSVVDDFKSLAHKIEALRVGGDALPSSILYGVTQALLEAVAKKKKMTMAEVISEEFGAPPSSSMIPIHVQTGDDRYIGADKAILKKADVLPQGLINTRGKIGENGEKLLEYAGWVANRIRTYGEKGYNPSIHFDTYGKIGEIFDNDLNRVLEYLLKLEKTVSPYPLQVEMPVDFGGKMETITAYGALNEMLTENSSNVMLVIDEWANKLEDVMDWADSRAAHIVNIKPTDIGSVNELTEAVLYCKTKGVKAYLGGSCNETDRAARVCAQVAIATSPYQISAKPGMSVDDAIMVVYNEMQRTLAIIAAR